MIVPAPSAGPGPSTVVTLPPIVEEPLESVVERVAALRPRDGRVLLGVTGAPGAGKSTLVAALAAALGADVAVVGMDGFHLADAQLRRLGSRGRKGAPDTFDSYGYANLLARLRADADPVIYAPHFDRSLEEPIAGAVAVPQGLPLIITEGNYLLLDEAGWPAARRCLDAVWFLDVPDDVRVRWLASRHERFGMPPDVAAERARNGSDAQNAVVVEGTRNRADLILRVTR